MCTCMMPRKYPGNKSFSFKCSIIIVCIFPFAYLNTVEPLNKRHVGTSHFVLCRDVVLSLEAENVLVLWESEYSGP